ncbi:DEKNAAC103814 [Brettanomyces naardenensis]|uniref:DEKNAAC103814 n=1 Tax=Brettanomyces naardenensis TaxID=13370 RepID=A0A448YPD9_BRENA|nr:DEKNAAC103814 [Brettanomyces naardenensis]
MYPTEVDITVPNGNKWSQKTGLFIDNEFVPSVKGETIEVEDPGTTKTICSVYLADKEDINKAVVAAKKAYYETWSHYSGQKRAEILYRLADLIKENSSHVADLESLESGKPKDNNAILDVLHTADVFRYYAGLAVGAQDGKTIETDPAKFTYTITEPYGVCGAVIAWNFPCSTFSWKVAPCLAAGNTLVLKTAELTPLSALYISELAVKAGLPAGVLNVTCGLGNTAGSALAEHPDVRKISFTGSTGVGVKIQEAGSKNLKYCTLECGGKSPLVVYDDADFDQAIKWASFGIFFNKGEICTASSRIYVQDTIYDEFVKKLTKYVEENLVQGPQFKKGVNVGPQVNKKQMERVLGYIEKGVAEGAKIATGGKRATVEGETGYFIEPTIFVDCNQKMSIVQEEIFGPVVTVSKFHTDEESIQLSNDSIYGLAAYVFTTNIKRSQKFIREVESGQIFVNVTFAADFRVPFGGYKMSGRGRELGEAGLSAFQQTKAVHYNLGIEL